ncbi:MAG TPA: pitrilysin family protein [Candidatus Krumholzibacteria bacterium]|nr:pitrilysin family protein [Candidatus Krumholzibacteria bacterium]HRX52436.1 pitrilysin family protein [Candidatus Krumholzibacteria bacterium]
MPSSPIARREHRRGLHEVTLANGLRVLIREDRRTAVAVCNVWVAVGSNREDEPVRGWSHGIEHMLFKGTDRRGEADFALEVADMGGTTNAGTGYETTNYHILCPAEHILGAVDILHDALFHSAFAPESLDPERQVLVHENHMYDDQPGGFGVTWKWALELAFDHSPYRHPIGGRDEALLETPRDAIVEFWKRAYRPDAMTVVICGDVDAEEVLDAVVKRFGAEPVPDLPPPVSPAPEPPRRGLRYRLVRGDVQRVYAKLVLPGLAETDPDRAALDVLQQILSDGRSSRLYRIVQEERELVSGITLLSEGGPREGLLAVDLETDAARIRAALAATAEVLAGLVDAPPAAAELQRAKIRAERSHTLGLETVQGQAQSLGWHDLMGDLDGAFHHPARVAAVTADQVQALARRLFRTEAMSLVLYVPQDAPEADLPSDAAQVEALIGAALPPRPAEATPPPPAAPAVILSDETAAAAASRDRPFEEVLLDGGLRCYVRRDPTLPVVSLGLYACGGVGQEPRGKEGLTALATQVHAKASRRLDATELSAFIEDRGASLGAHASRDHAGLHLTGLNRHLDELLQALGELACHPAFPEQELAKERRFAKDDLLAIQDDPFQYAALELRRRFYGDHPYAHPLVGTPAGLEALTRHDLTELHARTWVTRNLHVVVSGDVDRDRLLDGLGAALADLPHAPCPSPADLSQVPSPSGVERVRLPKDVRQSVVLTAWRGPDGPNSDRAALALIQTLLNGQSGRLFAELRNTRSLCYASGMMVARGLAPGMLAGYVLTSPEKEAEAADALAAEIRALAHAPAPAEEFERARARLVGTLLISMQSNNARVSRCAADVLYGRAPNNLAFYLDEIRRLTPESVAETAGRYLGCDDRHEIIVGPVP